MKALLLATALFVLPVAGYAQAPQQTPEPIITQKATEVFICSKMKTAQAKLDGTYEKIVKLYSYDPLFLKYLEASQQAWIAYRDAQLHTLYPPEYRSSYGSMQPSCECEKLTESTNIRTKELSRWLVGAKEGETCTGSLLSK